MSFQGLSFCETIKQTANAQSQKGQIQNYKVHIPRGIAAAFECVQDIDKFVNFALTRQRGL
jgi:hypothetical protein